MDQKLIDFLTEQGYHLEGRVSDATGVLKMGFVSPAGHYVDIYNASFLGEQ